MLLFWTSCVLPHGFQSRSGSLVCALSCFRAVIPKVASGVTPAFSTNRGVHCIGVYMAWQPSHFDPRTCSHQTYPQALVAPRSEPRLEPMAWAGARAFFLCHLSIFALPAFLSALKVCEIQLPNSIWVTSYLVGSTIQDITPGSRV